MQPDDQHVFYRSFEQWWYALDTLQSVFGATVSRFESTSIRDVRQVTLGIHLAQINDDHVKHCLLWVARYLDPLHQDAVPALQAEVEAAWRAIKTYLAGEGVTVIEADVKYPDDLQPVAVALPSYF